MSCIINRNTEGRVISVETPSGKKSELFNAIHGNMYMADSDTSVKVLSNIYTPKVESLFKGQEKYVYETGEPKLFYQDSKGREFSTLESLVLNGEQDGVATMGFKNPNTDSFMPMVQFSTRGSNRSEYLTSMVQQGFLSADRVLGEDGVTRYKGKGKYNSSQRMGAKAAKFEALMEGNGRTKVNPDGTFEVEFKDGYVTVVDGDGQSRVIQVEDIPQELRDNPNLEASATLRTLNQLRNLKIFNNTKTEGEKKVNLERLERSVVNFLTRMGISIATLENYKKNYNTKFGKDPDINALTDLANKVVAIAEGRAVQGDLLEEVAHIAIEAYADQNSIVSALANVHTTPEYTQHSEFYRAKYAPFYKGVALEEQVRREVLGKILAKELQERFDTTAKSESRVWLISKLQEIWEWASNLFSNNFRPYQSDLIRDLNRQIADNLLEESQTSFQEDFQSDNFYYSASTQEAKTIETTLKGTRAVLEDLFQSQLKEPMPNKVEIERITNGMEETEVLSSVNAISGVAENVIRTVRLNIKELDERSAKTGVKEPVSINDFVAFSTIQQNVLPALNSMKKELDGLEVTPENKATRDAISDRIANLRQVVAELEANIEQDLTEVVRNIYKQLLDETELTDEQKQTELSKLDGGIEDTGMMAKLFGLASNSANPIITLLHYKSAEMQVAVEQGVKEEVDSYLRKVVEQNLTKYQKDIIQKDSDGKSTYYYISPILYHEYDKAVEDKGYELLSEVSGKTVEEVKKLRDKRTHARTIAGTEAKYSEYRQKLQEYMQGEKERMMKDAYYEEAQEILDTAKASDYTRAWLKNFSADRARLRGTYSTDAYTNGTLDYSKLTEAQRQKEADATKTLKKVSEAYNEYGEVKPGLRVVRAENLTVEERESLPFTLDENFAGDIILPVKGVEIENLVDESRLALDLFNRNMVLRERRTNKGSRGASENFLETLKSFTDPEKAFEWAVMNGAVTLSDNFYENLGQSKNFNDVAQDWINQIPDLTERANKQALLNDVISLSRQRRSLLKQNRSTLNPLDTDAKNMQPSVRKKIREIEDNIAKNKQRLRLPNELRETVEMAVDTERVLTEDFANMLEEYGRDRAIEFMMEHMSEANKEKVQGFKYYIKEVFSGRKISINKGYEEFINQFNEGNKVDWSGSSMEEAVETLTQAYAKTKVASYFQRFEPTGYSEVLAALKSGDLSIVDLAEGKLSNKDFPALEFIEYTPSFNWQNDIDNTDQKNGNYFKQDFHLQPKVSKYLNKEFFTRFGIREQDYLKLEDGDISKLTPAKNVEQYTLLVETINLRKKALKAYGEEGSVNPFLRAQVGYDAATIEGAKKGLVSKFRSNASNALREVATNRVDKKEYGEQVEGEDITNPSLGVKVIPKYYLSKMAEPSSLTDNVIEAEVLMLQQSLLYKERKGVESDMRALQWKLANQNLYKSGVSKKMAKIPQEGSTSSYYSWADEYINNQLYGIKQTLAMKGEVFGYEVDFTNVINKLQSFTRFSNLGYNPFVAFTSMTTGVVTNLTDRFAKDYYAPSSASWSNSHTTILSGDYMRESGKMNKESVLNHITEYLGLGSYESKVKNSSFSRTLRFLGDSSYKLDKFANLAIHQRNILAVLKDYRVIDGKFYDYPNFKLRERQLNKEVSEREIQAKFDQAKDNSLYDMLKISKEGISIGSRFTELFGQDAENVYNNIRRRASNKAMQIIERADGVINKSDQVGAQRNVLTNMMMMHKGWLPILLTRRFKKRQFNIQLGKMEEGHYRSLMSFLGAAITNKGNLRKALAELEVDQRENIKRIRWEASIFAVLYLIGAGVVSMDDEDDTYIEDFARLIYLRTFSEFSTTQIFSVPSVMIDTAKSPIVAIRTIDAIEPIGLITDLMGDVGTFIAGEEGDEYKTWKKLKKNSFLKRHDQLSDIQGQIDAYRHFNRNTLYYLAKD